MEYIEINGVKYKVNSEDKTKPLLDAEGNKVLYEEPEPPTPLAPGKKTLEELAKEDPEIARLLSENKRLAEDQAERDRKAEAERKAQLEKNGEFQKLAEEAEQRAANAKQKLDEANAIIDKYKGTINELRDEMMAQIPEDKKSLVPEGSAKSQIEYIRKNVSYFGVSLLAKKGSEVPPNKDEPPIDEETKLTKEFRELMDKTNLTLTESARLTELSTLLKKLRAGK